MKKHAKVAVCGWGRNDLIKDCAAKNRRLVAGLTERNTALLASTRALLDLCLKLGYDSTSVDHDPDVIAARAAIAKAEGK